MVLRFVLMVNKQGQTRLAQYYERFSKMDERCALESEVIRKCLSRTETQCSFYEYRGYKVVYRRYASLFFIVGVEASLLAHAHTHKSRRKSHHTRLVTHKSQHKSQHTSLLSHTNVSPYVAPHASSPCLLTLSLRPVSSLCLLTLSLSPSLSLLLLSIGR